MGSLTSTHPLFKVNKQEFHEECHVVTGMKTMPDSQEHQRRNVTDVTIVKEFETFVDILENPQVGLNVKRCNVIAKAVSVLENSQLDVGTPAPIFYAGFFIA